MPVSWEGRQKIEETLSKLYNLKSETEHLKIVTTDPLERARYENELKMEDYWIEHLEAEYNSDNIEDEPKTVQNFNIGLQAGNISPAYADLIAEAKAAKSPELLAKRLDRLYQQRNEFRELLQLFNRRAFYQSERASYSDAPKMLHAFEETEQALAVAIDHDFRSIRGGGGNGGLSISAASGEKRGGGHGMDKREFHVTFLWGRKRPPGGALIPKLHDGSEMKR